jgi:hypothetical protein
MISPTRREPQRGRAGRGFEGIPSSALPAPYGALPEPARLIPASPARAVVGGASARFRLVLDRDPGQVSRAFLIYELAVIVTTKNGQVKILEAKSSATAPKTKNQKVAFPLIKTVGFKSKRSGKAYGATRISIIRPIILDKKGVFERILKN